MQLFDNYLNSLTDIISKKSSIKSFSDEGLNMLENRNLIKAEDSSNYSLAQSSSSGKTLVKFDRNKLTKLFGDNQAAFKSVSIGSHPDFEDIEHNKFLKHYCVSMFIDIKGSTRLNSKYTLAEIRTIKDTILTLAIHITSHFGGHVQRLQGDGIFLQFVRKHINEKDSVINALNAASVMANFMSTDLASVFESQDIRPLKIRIGIDLGYKDDVLWSHYGIPSCSELTTTSFHTDIAAKLQAKADSNGIMVGENIKNILDIKPEFCEDVYNNGEKDYYIFRSESMNYRMYNFNWIKYLNSFNFTRINTSRKGVEIEEPNIKIVCSLSDGTEISERNYFQNSTSIPKGTRIIFNLVENGHKYYIKNYESIEWIANNSGQEAIDAGHEKHDFGKEFHNRTHCATTAAYTGHHYVECILKRLTSDNKRIKFPIFI